MSWPVSVDRFFASMIQFAYVSGMSFFVFDDIIVFISCETDLVYLYVLLYIDSLSAVCFI